MRTVQLSAFSNRSLTKGEINHSMTSVTPVDKILYTQAKGSRWHQ